MKRSLSALSLVTILFVSACSSGPEVKSQAYATLASEKTFEEELPLVWKATLESLRNYKISDRDPKSATPVEMKEISEASLKTDWIYSQSRDKYVEYKVNGSPRRKALQMRMRLQVKLNQVIRGTKVAVLVDEEVERLRDNGKPNGYESMDKPDPERAALTLAKIESAILAMPKELQP